MVSSRRDLPNYMAELRPTLKNNQIAYYRRYSFTHNTGIELPKTGVSFLLRSVKLLRSLISDKIEENFTEVNHESALLSCDNPFTEYISRGIEILRVHFGQGWDFGEPPRRAFVPAAPLRATRLNEDAFHRGHSARKSHVEVTCTHPSRHPPSPHLPPPRRSLNRFSVSCEYHQLPPR